MSSDLRSNAPSDEAAAAVLRGRSGSPAGRIRRPIRRARWRLGFDVAVVGEGEATLLDLLRTLAGGGDLSTVAGIAFRDAAGNVQRTVRREPIDLDAFPPFPLRRRRMVGPIEITRGCPFACGFCQTSHLLGMRPRHRSVETIVRYAAAIRERPHCDVRVITPNAFSYGSPDGRTLNLPALESLLAALRRTLRSDGRLFFGTFPSEVRPEHVTDETLALLKRFANNDYLIIGAQSGSERMLAHCHRGHGVAEVLTATARILAAGLQPHVDFLFGLPGETDDDLDETIARHPRTGRDGRADPRPHVHAPAANPLRRRPARPHRRPHPRVHPPDDRQRPDVRHLARAGVGRPTHGKVEQPSRLLPP